MRVDFSNVLHVLAHELRTPTGIAQGYLRLLLDERLVDPADHRRALEQTQKALARITELTHQGSALASFFDGERSRTQTTIAVPQLVTRVTAEAVVEPPLIVDASVTAASGTLLTFDAGALMESLATLIRVTARELRNSACTLATRVNDGSRLDVLVGAAEQFPALAEGPQAAAARPLALDRGGVGLSLIHADAVLGAHGAERWTVDDARTAIGIRFRVEEGTIL